VLRQRFAEERFAEELSVLGVDLRQLPAVPRGGGWTRRPGGANGPRAVRRLARHPLLGGRVGWIREGADATSPSGAGQGDELNKLYLNQAAIGGCAAATYWSSSQYDGPTVWVQFFGTGGPQNHQWRETAGAVRAVRAF